MENFCCFGKTTILCTAILINFMQSGDARKSSLIPLQRYNKFIVRKCHYFGILNASLNAKHHKQLLGRKVAMSSTTKRPYLHPTIPKATTSTQKQISEQKCANAELKFIMQPNRGRTFSTYASTPHDFKNNIGMLKLFDSGRTAVNASPQRTDQTNDSRVMTYKSSPQHTDMSPINLARNSNLNHHLKIGGHPEKKLFYEIWTKSILMQPLRYHSHSVQANFDKVTDAIVKRLTNKSKRTRSLGEQPRKLKDSINSDIGDYSISKYNLNGVLHKKLKNVKYALQTKRQATSERKLRRAFKDLMSLLHNLCDKNVVTTFLRGIKIALQNKRHKVKHSKGQSSKGQSDKSQHRKSHSFKVRAKIKIHNRRRNNNYENFRSQTNKNLNYNDSSLASKQGRFNMLFNNRYDLARYIIAENILRSGWPFLPQQRNRTNFYRVIDMLRDEVVLKGKNTRNSKSDKKNITSTLPTTIEKTHVSMRTMDIISSTRSQNISLYQKYETNSSLDKKLSSVLYPSYQVNSSRLERTPYLPPSAAKHVLSQEIFPTKLEGSSNSRANIPRSSTMKTSKIVESMELHGQTKSDTSLSSTWQKLETESTIISPHSASLPELSSFSALLISSYMIINGTLDLESDTYIPTEVKHAFLTRHVAQKDNIAAAKSLISVLKEKNTAIPEEKLISDLIEAYDILLEEKSLSSYYFAATEIFRRSKEAVLNATFSVNSGFLPSTRYANAPVDYAILSTLYSALSSSTSKLNNLPLIDEEAVVPESEMQIHNRSELGLKPDPLNDTDSSSAD